MKEGARLTILTPPFQKEETHLFRYIRDYNVIHILRHIKKVKCQCSLHDLLFGLIIPPPLVPLFTLVMGIIIYYISVYVI